MVNNSEWDKTMKAKQQMISLLFQNDVFNTLKNNCGCLAYLYSIHLTKQEDISALSNVSVSEIVQTKMIEHTLRTRLALMPSDKSTEMLRSNIEYRLRICSEYPSHYFSHIIINCVKNRYRFDFLVDVHKTQIQFIGHVVLPPIESTLFEYITRRADYE